MGWKASCLLANARAPGFLGEFPQHDPKRCAPLLEATGLQGYQSAGSANFDQASSPWRKNELYLGAYDGAAVIGHSRLFEDCWDAGAPKVIESVSRLLPNSQILVIGLHSVVNFFGYAWYEDGLLQRVRAGAADEGVWIDFGEPLPFEAPLFDLAVQRDGQRFYLVDGEEYDEAAFGEEFVFEACRSFFGCRYDEFEMENLETERFQRKPWLARLLGR